MKNSLDWTSRGHSRSRRPRCFGALTAATVRRDNLRFPSAARCSPVFVFKLWHFFATTPFVVRFSKAANDREQKGRARSDIDGGQLEMDTRDDSSNGAWFSQRIIAAGGQAIPRTSRYLLFRTSDADARNSDENRESFTSSCCLGERQWVHANRCCGRRPQYVVVARELEHKRAKVSRDAVVVAAWGSTLDASVVGSVPRRVLQHRQGHRPPPRRAEGRRDRDRTSETPEVRVVRRKAEVEGRARS